MGLIERFETGGRALFIRPESPEKGRGFASRFGLFEPTALDVDVMGLIIKDELLFGPLFSAGRRLQRFDRIDLVGLAKDFVEADQRRRHPAGRMKKVASR